ncbi:MAG: type II toxin-antitoxin system MqsA family antitoxin [Deltaproteobacteria bacterium]|nr:type II toxin-antitoxin system MqsA family antitoxin [Deltaproteobacteria bacterium]
MPRNHGVSAGSRSFRTGPENQKEKTVSGNLGRCPLCGGEKQPGTTTFAVDLDFGVVVVRSVPALVCSQCGDAWIEDPVALKLEGVVADARRRQAVVEVSRWDQVAA